MKEPWRGASGNILYSVLPHSTHGKKCVYMVVSNNFERRWYVVGYAVPNPWDYKEKRFYTEEEAREVVKYE